MTEGIYVIEFSNGTVKIGRTTSLADRLRTHNFNVEILGGSAVQIWTCSTIGSRQAEERILAMMRRHPTAEPAAGAREVFKEVTFSEAVSVARDICMCYPPDALHDDDILSSVELPDLLREILAVFTERGCDRISSSDLVAALQGRSTRYRSIDQLGLAGRLREYGIRPKKMRIGAATLSAYQASNLDSAADKIRVRQLIGSSRNPSARYEHAPEHSVNADQSHWSAG